MAITGIFTLIIIIIIIIIIIYSTINKKFQNYTDMKEAFVRIWQLNVAYIVP
jgi:hypothetical protein